MKQQQTGNTMCLEDSVASIAQTVKANGNGSTNYLLKSFQKTEEKYPYLISPYPIENPIIEVLNVGDISFRMGELEDAAYCLTGSYSNRTEWKKGTVFYAEGNSGGMSNISIFDANDKLIRQLEIMNYCGFYILSPDGSQTTSAGCFVRDYKTANW